MVHRINLLSLALGYCTGQRAVACKYSIRQGRQKGKANLFVADKEPAVKQRGGEGT